tara:strand:+ start:2029 stop:2199 length:171 start_codon:yes stop_codon:yes gene_type:complete
MSRRDNPIFSKWLWIVPIGLFFIMFFVAAFLQYYEPDKEVLEKGCFQLPTASTRVC